MTLLRNVKFINAGFCSQLAAWTGVSSWKWAKFNAVVVYFEHPTHGAYLIDTGYGEEFYESTKKFPYRIYRWLVPPTIDAEYSLIGGLKAAGIDPNQLAGVMVSHFHPDHIAGLASLPKVPIHTRIQPLEQLRKMRPMEQLHHGFVPGLFPKDRDGDIIPISEDQFCKSDSEMASTREFSKLDYWDDGSLVLLDLPGHALGHTGFLLNTEHGRKFYIVDAAWSVDVLLQGNQLPRISRRLQTNYDKYWKTQQLLKQFSEENSIELIACHCPRTQAIVGCRKQMRN